MSLQDTTKFSNDFITETTTTAADTTTVAANPNTRTTSANHLRASSVSLLAEAVTNGTPSSSEFNRSYDNDSSKDVLSEVRIYDDIITYEKALSRLIDSVDKFKPNLNIAQELIQADKSLFDTLNSFIQYDEIDLHLKALETKASKIDELTQSTLQTLNECHDDLNKLPTLPQIEFELNTILNQRTKINSTILLDYATKLSKFTKIPPTFDKGSIGPNNFIWPAEDSLRRGMLAMASLKADQLTYIPGQAQSMSKEKALPTEVQETQEQTQTQQQDQEEQPRRESFVFSGKNKEEEEETTHTHEDSKRKQEEKDHESGDEDAMDIDLDLFNPDEF
ncbi:Med4p NDAI_0J01320 [Naumovozyma dairenensis CBS 421]|uniref:Mediator of RNA polymerase II transcription subunit 4 n=1 Tax=Naumovozyma dairenensis (strain ATCC 10597 / BCRC 20456 / CBS 421 / NBRC 0211 / NRRL Y-12639) TaxID=1071378 RepID=G0WGU6_NAUDC|nr:hypothetical protein NDAI_0J01320 [Naumovozyma dairenensis CBS 421]CCD27024.1 hypothetical protein NDAI_0J01320 [Naumovozyma dairenensis CBS 421]